MRVYLLVCLLLLVVLENHFVYRHSYLCTPTCVLYLHNFHEIFYSLLFLGEAFKFRIQYGLLVFTSLNTVSLDALLTP